MTKEEAIKILSNRDSFGIPKGYTSGYAEAIDMAIKSLKSWDEGVIHGKWIDKGHDNIYECSKCGDMWMGVGGYNYCPSCGADMRERS